MSDHRWQGYSHQELFEQINNGPGAEGSTDSIRRWTELTRALGEIDSGLASALASAMAGWEGDAADSARGGLRPLGDWAMEAQQAADTMRQRAEQQAEFVSKARTDMPPPVQVSAEQPNAAVSLLTHLFGGQTDYEVQEAQQNAAEQRAFEVMRTYESSTTANTTSLASFTSPPQVVVDAPATGTGAPSSLVRQPITISWESAVPAAASGVAGGAAASRAAAPPHRADRRPSRAAGERSARAGGNSSAGSRIPKGRNDSDHVDHKVTEELGRPGGFFDEQQTLARPVIGGEPNR